MFTASSYMISNHFFVYTFKECSNYCHTLQQVIRVKKLVGLPPPHSNYLASLLGSEEPSLKLLRSEKLQRTNSSPISNCRRSKSAIFISCKINYIINSMLLLHVGTHIIYIYVAAPKNDQTLFIGLINAVCSSVLICVGHFVAIFGVRYNDPVYGKLNLISKPMLVFNLDETNVTIVHKPGKVVTELG